MSLFLPAEVFSCLVTADLHHDANPTSILGTSVHVPADKANEMHIVHQEVEEPLTSPEDYVVLLMFLHSGRPVIVPRFCQFTTIFPSLVFGMVFMTTGPSARCQSGRVLLRIKFILGLAGEMFQGRSSNF